MKVGDLVEVSDEALRDMFSRMEMEMPIGDVTWKMPGLVATADEKMTNTIVYKYKLSRGFLVRKNKPRNNKVPINNRKIGILSIITSGATPCQKGALAKPR